MAPTNNDGEDGSSVDKASHLINGAGPAGSTEATASATNTPVVDGKKTSNIAPSQSTSDQTPAKDKSILGCEEADISSLSPRAGDDLKAVSSPLTTKTGESTEKDSSNTNKDGICSNEAKSGNEKNSGDAVSLETPTAGAKTLSSPLTTKTGGSTEKDSSNTNKDGICANEAKTGNEKNKKDEVSLETPTAGAKTISSPLTTKTGKSTEKDSSNTNEDGICVNEVKAGNERNSEDAVSLETPTSGGTKPLESEPEFPTENIKRTAVGNVTSPDGGPLCQSSSLGNQEDDKLEDKTSTPTHDSSSKGLPAATDMEKREKVALPSTTTSKEGETPSNKSASLPRDITSSVPSAKKSSTNGTEQSNGKTGDFSKRSVASMPKPTSDRAPESAKGEGKAMKSNASLAKSGSSSLDLTTRKQQTAPNQLVDSSDDSLLGSPAIAKKKKSTTSLAAKPPSKAKSIEITPPDTDMTDAFASNAQSEKKDEPLISEPPPKPPTNVYEIAEQTNEPVRTQHKHMLLKLFLNVDEKTLRELKDQCDKARPAETQALSEQQSTNNRRRQRTQSPPSNISLFPREEKLGLLPAALQEFQDVCEQHASAKRPSLIIEDSKKRKSYSSRSLQDLEHLVNAKFLESRLCKDTTSESLASPNQQDSEKIFTPFTLEYNECSISAIARWGRKGSPDKAGQPPKNSKKAWTDTMPHDRPAVSALFRKCTVCSRYGHYEIECNELLKDEKALLALAHKTKMQGITSELLEKGKDPHDLNFRHVGFEKIRAIKVEAEEEPPDDDHARKYFGCELCHSGADDDNMLICDGCDKLFHLYCLDPPLEKVPDGDWFCLKCEVSTRDVDSDVEIEACEDFVIEQRKKPREDKFLSKEKGFGFAKDDGWNTAMAVVGDDVNAMPDGGGGLSPRRKRPRNLAYREEETEIDGFVITAKATSDSLDIARRIKASHVSAEDMSKAPLVPGSIVLWFTTLLEEVEKTTNETSEEPPAMLVGAVLAVDAVSREALVRPIPQWKQLILDFRAENDSDLLPRLEECAMRAVSSASTVWVPTESLHVVAHEPPEDATTTFSEILPERVANERSKRDPSKLAPRHSQQRARIR
jgi:hypothetical protein